MKKVFLLKSILQLEFWVIHTNVHWCYSFFSVWIDPSFDQVFFEELAGLLLLLPWSNGSLTSCHHHQNPRLDHRLIEEYFWMWNSGNPDLCLDKMNHCCWCPSGSSEEAGLWKNLNLNCKLQTGTDVAGSYSTITDPLLIFVCCCGWNIFSRYLPSPITCTGGWSPWMFCSCPDITAFGMSNVGLERSSGLRPLRAMLNWAVGWEKIFYFMVGLSNP